MEKVEIEIKTEKFKCFRIKAKQGSQHTCYVLHGVDELDNPVFPGIKTCDFQKDITIFSGNKQLKFLTKVGSEIVHKDLDFLLREYFPFLKDKDKNYIKHCHNLL